MPKKLPDNVSYHHYRDMFKVALTGIHVAYQEEKNSRFDLVMAFLVIIMGFVFHVQYLEWCLLLLCIGMVLTAEMFNTAIENVVDMICMDYHPMAKKVKDIASGAVLIICIVSAIIGLAIFVPYIQ